MDYLRTDDQTTSDLAIFGRSGKPSIFRLYNKTQTSGGEKRLRHLFKHPLADEQLINQRAARYHFFSKQNYVFPVDSGEVAALAYYMENDDPRSQLQPDEKTLGQKLKDTVAADSDQIFVRDGVRASLSIFHQLEIFINRLQDKISGSPFEDQCNRFTQILEDEAFAPVKEHVDDKNVEKLKLSIVAKLDKIIRFNCRKLTLNLLDMLYDLDVCITIGKVAQEKDFNFARALSQKGNKLCLNQVWHPNVEGAIANDIEMDASGNLVFLTGANMAGKSTLLKAVAVALYLAHIGLPVAADDMEFAVRDGIYVNINLADNLETGASHFYAEVLRVKEVAHQLKQGKKLFIIFDELFRGTNVKDAYDGTVELVRAFSRKKASQFIISTHIMEAGEHLSDEDLSVQYLYLPTEMEGNTPVYTRILKEGITDDRKGMAIIENENIFELLDAGIDKQTDKKQERCLS